MPATMLNLLQKRQKLQEYNKLWIFQLGSKCQVLLISGSWLPDGSYSTGFPSWLQKSVMCPRNLSFIIIIFKVSPLENSQQSNLLQMGYSRPPWNKTVVVNLNKHYFLFIMKQF